MSFLKLSVLCLVPLILVSCGDTRSSSSAASSEAAQILGQSCDVLLAPILKIQEVGPLLTNNEYYRTDQLNDYCDAMTVLTNYQHLCDLSPEQTDFIQDLYLEEVSNYDYFCFD